jgi:hypothetical protein
MRKIGQKIRLSSVRLRAAEPENWLEQGLFRGKRSIDFYQLIYSFDE